MPLKNELKIRLIATKEVVKKELRDKFMTLILSAFGLVAALAWNEAIISVFKFYFGEAANLVAKFTYAIVVTLIVVIVTYWINKLIIKENKEEKK